MTEFYPFNHDSSSSSDSDSTSGSGAGAGAGAIGLAGAGAIAGSGALSGSESLGSNCNDNANCNDNSNENSNTNTSTTTVEVHDYVTAQVSADVCGPPSHDQSDNSDSFNTTSTTTNLNLNLSLTDSPINLADANNFLAGSGDNFSFSGNGTDSAFHVDQVNSLIANNTLSCVSLTNDSSFTQTASDTHGGSATGGMIDGGVGDSVTASVSTAASATSTLSAFTQNIVLGANIQYNSLSQSAIGGGVTHTASVATADPGHGMSDHWHP